ncbi:MAG: glycosyl transferase family 9 [Firmicutes bacterium]|nr:glycosyl transferase family 9 [Bacillota bacterium]
MVKEVLIIRLSSIGDVIHCTPVARSLKISWPDCRITWLIGEVAAELLKYNPYVDEIIVWSREKFEKYLRGFEFEKALAMWRTLREQLSARSFHAVLDIHGLFITGMIAKLARTNRRIGMSQARELNSLFMTETATPCGSHITDKYLGVLLPLGIDSIDHQMFLAITEQERGFAEEFLVREGIVSHEKFVVVIPGTTWLSKNWPTELFAQTIQILCKDFKIVMCGGKGEGELGIKIQQQVRVPIVNAVGKTSLLEMAALIERGTVVIAGDTGPLHIAAALMVPTVSIFGPTNPATYAPLGQGNAILVNNLSCSFCHKLNCPQGNAICMSSITPRAVAEQVYRISSRGRLD